MPHTYTNPRAARVARGVAVLVLLSGVPLAWGQSSAREMAELVPSFGGLPGAGFGSASALSADGLRLVVGAPLRGLPSGSTNTGRAYVFTRASLQAAWELEQMLTAQGGGPDEWFASELALDGELLAVSADGNTALDDGAVYVFRRVAGRWLQEARLERTLGGPTSGSFGRAIALAGSTLVVSDTAAGTGGEVYTYGNTGGAWLRQATLVRPSGSTGSFGVALALDGERLAIGLQRDTGAIGGEVRVYRRSGLSWSLEDVVQPDTVPYGQFPNDRFGTALDLVGGTLLVGASGDQVPGNAATAERGAAFVFLRSGASWTQYSRLVPLNLQQYSRFGARVQLASELHAIVGAPGNPVLGTGSVTEGAAHVFRQEAGLWIPRQVLRAAEARADDRLGTSVSIAVVGPLATAVAGTVQGGPVGGGTAHSFELSGTSWSEVQRIQEPAKDAAQAGQAVALLGDLALIGAPWEDSESGEAAGAAYLYQRVNGTWQLRGRLVAPMGEALDRFGTSVSFAGDYLAVGAPADDYGNITEGGSVFIFTRSSGSANLVTYSYHSTLRPSDPGSYDGFGASLGHRDGLLCVGSPGADLTLGSDAGAAYLFALNGAQWSQAAKVRAVDGAAGDQLGSSVAVVSATRVVVGAPRADAGGANTGALYVFDRTPIVGGVAWTQRTKLTAPGASAGDRLGEWIATSGNRIAGGAPGYQVGGISSAGAIAVFEFSGPPGTSQNTFTFRQRLTDPSPASNGGFGESFSLSGTLLVSGVSQWGSAGTGAGKALLYERSLSGAWSYCQELRADEPRPDERRGRAVALSGRTVLIGAPGRSSLAGERSGAGLVFDLWIGGDFGKSYCTSVVNSTGVPARIRAYGSPILSENALRLRAEGMPSASTGYFITSRSPGFVTTPGGARGNLCLGGTIGRFVGPGQVLSTGVGGAFELPVDLGSLPQAGSSAAAFVGERWHFQAWFRDNGVPGFSSNFTDGMHVTVH